MFNTKKILGKYNLKGSTNFNKIVSSKPANYFGNTVNKNLFGNMPNLCNNAKQFAPKKRYIVADKPVEVYNNYPVPQKKYIKKAYEKIPDDVNVPLQFMTREQYIKRYIKNQEKVHNVDFCDTTEKEYLNKNKKSYSNIVGRYTTKSNPYYPAAVVVFNDPVNYNNIKGKKFVKLAHHEYGHELFEKNNMQMPLFNEEQFADHVADYGTTRKVFCDDRAKNYALKKLNSDNVSKNKLQQDLRNTVDLSKVKYTRPNHNIDNTTMVSHVDAGRKRNIIENTIKHYPNLIPIINKFDGEIVISESGSDNVYGSYDSTTNTIILPPAWHHMSARDRAEIMFHELQHWQQNKDYVDNNPVVGFDEQGNMFSYKNNMTFAQEYDNDTFKKGSYRANKYEKDARIAGAKGIADIDYSHLPKHSKQSFINHRQADIPGDKDHVYSEDEYKNTEQQVQEYNIKTASQEMFNDNTSKNYALKKLNRDNVSKNNLSFNKIKWDSSSKNAYLTPEQYQNRAERAAERMESNKQFNSLTEEQHDALAALASIRHKIHSSGNSLYFTESGPYDELWSELDRVTNLLYIANLGKPYTINLDMIPNDNDTEYGIIDDTEQAKEDNIWKFHDQMSILNSQIEDYLRAIDKKHGTSYAPTGTHRIVQFDNVSKNYMRANPQQIVGAQQLVSTLNNHAFQPIVDTNRAAELITERLSDKKMLSPIFDNLSSDTTSGNLFKKRQLDPTYGTFFVNINFLASRRGNTVLQSNEYKSVDKVKQLILSGQQLDSVPGYSLDSEVVEEGNHRVEALRQLGYTSCPVQIWDGW